MQMKIKNQLLLALGLCALLILNACATQSGGLSLTVDIQGGFTGQRVIVFVDDQVVWDKKNVVSDGVIEYADSFKVPNVAKNSLNVVVAIDGVKFSKAIQLGEGHFIGIARGMDGKLFFRVSKARCVYD